MWLCLSKQYLYQKEIFIWFETIILQKWIKFSPVCFYLFCAIFCTLSMWFGGYDQSKVINILAKKIFPMWPRQSGLHGRASHHRNICHSSFVRFIQPAPGNTSHQIMFACFSETVRWFSWNRLSYFTNHFYITLQMIEFWFNYFFWDTIFIVPFTNVK